MVSRYAVKPLLAISVFISLLFISGCAPTLKGPQFQTFTEATNGKALIYFYRPDQFFGKPITYDIWRDDGKPFVTMVNGGYYPHLAEPGKATFKGETEAVISIDLDLEADKVYYVWCSVQVGVWIGRPYFELMEESTAATDITTTKLLPPFTPG